MLGFNSYPTNAITATDADGLDRMIMLFIGIDAALLLVVAMEGLILYFCFKKKKTAISSATQEQQVQSFLVKSGSASTDAPPQAVKKVVGRKKSNRGIV